MREVASRDYSAAQIAVWAPEPPDLAAWSRRLQTGAVFVYERNGEIAGFLRIVAGYVDLLYVHPEVQRHGIARALVGRAIAWAVGQAISRLHSEVSTTARPFFESVGFRVVRQQAVERQGVLFSNFRMERDIRAEPSAAADAPQAARR